MVLRETAILMRVRAAPRAGSQVRAQLLQLDRRSSDFDPDKNSSVRRSHEQIEIVRMGMMLCSPWLDKNVSRKPATLDDEPGRCGQLANIFAQKPWRFRGENSVRARIAARFVATQQRTLDFAPLVDAKQILIQPAQKIVRFPFGERRSDSKT